VTARLDVAEAAEEAREHATAAVTAANVAAQTLTSRVQMGGDVADLRSARQAALSAARDARAAQDAAPRAAMLARATQDTGDGPAAAYALTDTPPPCPVCGAPRTVEVDMAESDAEPFAWCESCSAGTFRSEEPAAQDTAGEPEAAGSAHAGAEGDRPPD
jgi:hypothetical protein